MKIILVTGGAGYIGSVLVGLLLNKGLKVRVLDRFMFGGEGLLAYAANNNLEIVSGDIRDKKILKKCLTDVEDIIHLAAFVGEPACKEDPVVTRQINFEATRNLALLSKSVGINRFIFASTCSNYGISKINEEATEDSELNPLSLYAETKIASEEFLLSIKDADFHPTILRFATIFGLSPRMRFNLIVNELAREAARGGKFSFRNENAWRPFLHVKDASSAIIKVLEESINNISGEIFNVVSENVQKKALKNLVRKANPKVNIIVEGATDDKRDYRVSADKFKKKLSWKSEFSVEHGFFEIYNAVKKEIFIDPYDFKFNGWFDKKVFFE